jgi:uncharacterized protein (TIGR00299 family) protein
MILGALVDAGCGLDALTKAVARLSLPGVTLSADKVRRHDLAATQVVVSTAPETPAKHRHLPEVLQIIDAAGLEPSVAECAAAIFRRLAEAEASAHAIPIEKVHFHEVGAADAIVDIVCACVGAAELGLERIICSPIPTGSGTVTCEHGVLPVPAPATVHLLKGVPLADCDEPGELTTPTGAAILTTLADDYGPLPPMRISSVGCGAGTREGQTRPNLLRLIVGEAEPEPSDQADVVSVLEAQCDDATGQTLAYACERLREAGALDAFMVPIIMKKGRPGQLLTVLCRREDVAALETIIFRETTTLGIRCHEARRSKLAREHVAVQTRFGTVRIKLGRRGDQTVRAWPEYEDCARIARQNGVPLREVQQEALRVWASERA